MTSTPPPVPPRRPKHTGSAEGFSEEFKKKLSAQLEIQAKKISGESKIINGSLSDSYEYEGIEEEFERGIPIAESPMPTVESEQTANVEEKRKTFLSRVLSGIKRLAKSVRDSRGAAAVGNFISNLGTKRAEAAAPAVLEEPQEKELDLSVAKDAVVGLIQLLDEIEAINEEGLFRTVGSAANVKDFIAQLKEGKIDLPDPTKSIVLVPDIASQLKAIIREMKVFDNVKADYLKVGGMGSKLKDPDEKMLAIQKIQSMLDTIDPEAKEIMRILLTYLAKVSENNSVNLMTASNLATCFGPNMYTMDLTDAATAPLANATFKFMIENVDQIFQKGDIE